MPTFDIVQKRQQESQVLKAIITETLSYHLRSAMLPNSTLKDRHAFAQRIISETDLKFKSRGKDVLPNVEFQDFQHRCAAARLVFDSIETFEPCSVLNAGVDGLYGFANEIDLSLIATILTILTIWDPNSIGDLPIGELIRRHRKIFEEHAPRPLTDSAIDKAGEFLKVFVPDFGLESKNAPIILSRDPFYSNHYLANMDSNNSEAILAVLATAGIAFSLPAIYPNNEDTFEEIKEKFAEERLDYLLFLEGQLGKLRTELSSKNPNVEEIYEFANKEISVPLKLKAEKFEIAVSKASASVLKRLATGSRDAAPEIGSALFANDEKLGPALVKAALKILSSGIRTQSAYQELRKKHPEAAYIYQIRKRLKN